MPVPTLGKYQGVLFGEGGQFHDYYKNVKKAVNGDKLKHFLELQTPSDRANYLLRLPAVTDIKVEACKPIYDKEKALVFKEKGNDFFRERNFGEAFKHYTLALSHYPHNEEKPDDPINKDYSIILANRSAALDGAGLFEACVKDIDRAIKFGYPREFWYKVYKRQGHAYVKLRMYINAKEALEIALKNVGRSDIKKEKDRDNYRARIRKQMTVFNVTKTLYNVERIIRTPSCLAGGEEADRGISKKVKISGGTLVTEEEVESEDILVALDPYVAVVNVTGGRAGGKICPHTIAKMFNPAPCKFGSEALFGDLKARDEASAGYHRFEWSILANLERDKVLEAGRLALRMITKVEPEQVTSLSSFIGKSSEAAPEALREAVKTFNMDITHAKEEDKLVAALMGIYLTRNLNVCGYVRLPSKDGSSLSQDELEVFGLAERAVLVALAHSRPITLMDVPKQKNGYMETPLVTDTCAFGIYPDLPVIESASKGPEKHVFSWNLDAKLVMTSFRRLEAGQPVYLVEQRPEGAPREAPANDMITFRCANEICPNYFPLKENTKEKIISCPLDDCGIKTNIWERLKLIQRLKKDFQSAKTEFDNSEVEAAKDILKATLDEWDRIVVRPYREIDQLQALYLKCLICGVADSEREFVEGNIMGYIMNKAKKPDVYPKDEEANGMTTKTFTIKPPS